MSYCFYKEISNDVFLLQHGVSVSLNTSALRALDYPRGSVPQGSQELFLANQWSATQKIHRWIQNDNSKARMPRKVTHPHPDNLTKRMHLRWGVDRGSHSGCHQSCPGQGLLLGVQRENQVILCRTSWWAYLQVSPGTCKKGCSSHLMGLSATISTGENFENQLTCVWNFPLPPTSF